MGLPGKNLAASGRATARGRETPADVILSPENERICTLQSEAAMRQRLLQVSRLSGSHWHLLLDLLNDTYVQLETCYAKKIVEEETQSCAAKAG
jgi:hypothetical protein